MKKIFLIGFIVSILIININAQLTNTSYWEYRDIVYTNLLTGTTNIITNFYKFIVTYPNWITDNYLDTVLNRTNYINAYPGETLYLRHFIHNVGSINEANGVSLKVGLADTNINATIYDSATNNVITNTSPIIPGGSYEYVVRVSIPTNYTGIFTLWITNTGSTNGPPYPYRVIVKHTIRVIRATIIIKKATDSVHTISLCNGTQPLGNLDINVYIEIPDITQIVDVNSLKLYYDFNAPPDGSQSDGTVNVNREVNFQRAEGNLWVATIPITDPEFKPGNTLYYIISIDGKLYDQDGLVGPTESPPNNPWKIPIREYVTQQPEAEHTISLNNKFDPRVEDYYLIYKLTRRSHVNVSIYNVRGELVRQLKNEVEDIGKHVVKWDGKNEDGEYVAMGLYLVIIQSSEFGEIRKVIVIKR